MSITNLFEKIAGRQKQREKSRIEDFRSLVRAIAHGEEPDADRVDAVLLESGQSLEDLKEAVELLQKRMESKAKLDTVPKLEAEQAELEAKIGKATEILNTAEAKYAEVVNPLRWQLEEIKSNIQQMWNLPQQLAETCPYPELVERAAQIERAKREAHEEATALRRRIEEHLMAVREYESQAEKSSHKPHQQEYRERAKHRSAQATETQAKLKQTLKRIDDLDKQEAAIREQMMVP
jgi:DNA repair exonuclease SbcCD ATPase subunit